MSYLGMWQDHTGTVSHLDFGYFDLVTKLITVPKAVTQKYNMVYICSRHAKDQYCGFSFESLALVLQKSDYYHLIIGQIVLDSSMIGSPREKQCSRG